ncbi:hypothetical protein F8R89_02240 [Streptomyces sp. SS1-1]|uniref:hypothetical protein n=1 Tax=Streptomyces sp. SS1-1 TaxID=2651869 RepID=UPI00124FF470|nr:hypothetical protein [Streptomyces sp. SS1-1]KAB2976952.1 hypothetical protein F8R89_02240 [Streptomyces sp. SS1-1]
MSAEQQRHRIGLSEARRGERLALLERFIEVSAEAERCAYTLPTEWEGLPDGESVRDFLEGRRLAFLDAARAVMG